MPDLVIIQTVYKNDKPEYLQQSIDSILNQTYSDFKLLLGIDGPIGDDLRTVITHLKDERIQIINNEVNRGLACMLNDLLKICQATGYTFIARMDSDDIALNDRFEKQITFLKYHLNIDLVGGAINEIDEYGNNRGKIIRYPTDPDECRKFFSKRNPVAHPAVMFHKRFFEKVGYCYPTDYVRNEDTCLWYEGYKHGATIVNLPDIILNYRVTNNMFKQRRNGCFFAKSQLNLRKKIAYDLGYGKLSIFYAYCMFLLMISPSWILKLAYRFLR